MLSLALWPSLHGIWNAIVSVIHTMTPLDFLDIAFLSYVIYYFIRLIRETRAGQLLKGIAFLVGIYLVCKFAEIKAITFLLEALFRNGLLAILVVFQPEVRRAVEKLGHSRFGLNALGLIGNSDETIASIRNSIDVICDSCAELSLTNTGALIVIERQTRLGELIEGAGTGTEGKGRATILNATPSRQLFGNIFYPKTPLHDGAVLMRDGIILAAACYLPPPQDQGRIDKRHGSRHRAAIGMSENSDSVVVVVSEETGTVSIAEGGTLTSIGRTADIGEARLVKELRAELLARLHEQLVPKESRLRLRGRTRKKGGDAK